MKVALRLHDEPELADAIDDTTGGMRGLTTSWRKQRDLGTQIAASLRQEVLGQRGHNPPDDSEQEAAVGIATAVVSSLAGQAGALTEALVHPEQFHQFVLDHGGTAARAESVAERAEPLYDRILAASCERIVMLAPTSRRAISATMAALLRSHEALSAELSEDVAETRAGVEELLDITRREQRPDRDRVEAVAASLPWPKRWPTLRPRPGCCTARLLTRWAGSRLPRGGRGSCWGTRWPHMTPTRTPRMLTKPPCGVESPIPIMSKRWPR